MTNLYNTNDTMRLVGNQQLPTLEELGKIKDILNAHLEVNKSIDNDTICSIARDCFNLGKIYGKEER